jgi:hypothetical protein
VAVRKELPQRPPGMAVIDDTLWNFWQATWRIEPNSRPNMVSVLNVMTTIGRDHRPLRLLAIGRWNEYLS